MNTTATLEAPSPVHRRIVEDEPLYEIIDGQRQEIPPMSAFAAFLASQLLGELHVFVKAHDLGRVMMETLFHLALPVDRNRRPDLAFVSYERWPKDQPRDKEANAWDVVPDLAVEVISPHDLAEETMDKLQEYFEAGVRLVWVIYPRHCLVHVYESLTDIRVLARHNDLDGGAVLPGLRLPLTEIFLEEPEPLTPADHE